MSRVHMALRVGDLDGSIAFYSTLFNTDPAKLRPGYANFAIAEPALKLVLLAGSPGQPTVLDHLGVEVESTEQVEAASHRLTDEGLPAVVENDTTCCYARQDKVWVTGPGDEPWEVYTVTADSATYGGASQASVGAAAVAACCRRDPATGEVDTAAQPEGCCP